MRLAYKFEEEVKNPMLTQEDIIILATVVAMFTTVILVFVLNALINIYKGRKFNQLKSILLSMQTLEVLVARNSVEVNIGVKKDWRYVTGYQVEFIVEQPSYDGRNGSYPVVQVGVSLPFLRGVDHEEFKGMIVHLLNLETEAVYSGTLQFPTTRRARQFYYVCTIKGVPEGSYRAQLFHPFVVDVIKPHP